MATTTMTSKSQLITVSGTTEHEIDFNDVLKKGQDLGYAFITMVSGTAVQFDCTGVTITSTSLTLASSGNNTRDALEITRGVNIKYKGGAGSETFNINIQAK